MRRVRVLVVDDAVVVRKMVTDVLAADPQIEVVGIAANGKIALQKISQCTPDLVTLDVEMPEMDGLTTIAEIRKTWHTLPVIMFSTLTERGASATLEALSRGATDYVTKPANVGSVTIAQQRIRDELIPKIKALCTHVLAPVGTPLPRATVAPRIGAPVAGPSTTTATSAIAPLVSQAASRLSGPVVLSTSSSAALTIPRIIAIGSSTGGPNALIEVIPKIPALFPVPIVITQHMPPMFTRLLADRLSSLSRVPVREAADGDVIRPGTVWVAPGDYHMSLERRDGQVVAALLQTPHENSCRPAVDVMLRSAVHCFGAGVLSVILTGMGQDGLRGSELVHDNGGSVIAQDEATSVVWGMPGFVAKAGIASAVLPLSAIAPAIIAKVNPLTSAGSTCR